MRDQAEAAKKDAEIEKEAANQALVDIRKVLTLSEEAREKAKEVEDLYKAVAECEAVMRRVVETIHSSFDLEETFEKVVNELGLYLEADRCFISRYNAETNELSAPTKEYRSSEQIMSIMGAKPVLWKDLCSFAKELCRQREPIDFSSQSQGLSSESQSILGEIKLKSGIGCSIHYDQTCLGILFIHQVKDFRVWNQEEIKLMQSISRHISLSIYQAELYQQEKFAKAQLGIRSKQQDVVAAIGISALKGMVLQELMNLIVKSMAETLHVEFGKVLSYSPEKNTLRFVSIYGWKPELLNFEGNLDIEPHADYTLRSSQPVIVNNIKMETRFRPSPLHEENGILSGISVVIGGEEGHPPYGVLEADSNSLKTFSKDDIDFLQALANILAMAIIRKQADDNVQEANQRKSQFLASMSHELRTPLNAIIGYSEMLQKGMGGRPLVEKEKVYVENVSLSGRHLLNMINDILDISKIEAGKMELHITDINLESFISEIEQILHTLTIRNNIQLSFEVGTELDGLQADPDRLKQIFFNLVSNAIKFNQVNGSVHVQIYKSEDKKWVICEIRDTGIGIPENKMGELFTEFFQVDNSFSRLQPGTGLGLALTRQLVELHGGSIMVESKEGVGSMFRFTLPVFAE